MIEVTALAVVIQLSRKYCFKAKSVFERSNSGDAHCSFNRLPSSNPVDALSITISRYFLRVWPCMYARKIMPVGMAAVNMDNLFDIAARQVRIANKMLVPNPFGPLSKRKAKISNISVLSMFPP